MASIDFTDGTGATSLKNNRTAPADRFIEWTPQVSDIASEPVVTLAGVTHRWRYTSLDGVSFALDKLPPSMQTIANRLTRWLLDGNTVTVTTGDSSSRTYTCRLMPGTVPEFTVEDDKRLRWRYQVSLVNTSSGAMLCTYDYQ